MWIQTARQPTRFTSCISSSYAEKENSSKLLCDQGNQDTLPVIVQMILLATKLLREINDEKIDMKSL